MGTLLMKFAVYKYLKGSMFCCLSQILLEAKLNNGIDKKKQKQLVRIEMMCGVIQT